MTNENEYILKQKFVCKPDQTVIIKRKFLPYFRGLNKVVFREDEFVCPENEESYPAVNSYYPFTDDVDAFSRVHHLIDSVASNNSLETNFDYKPINEYASRQALYQYLRKNPVSFIILGKPGLGEDDIGKRLADYWKCVYIDPLTLLQEEIISGTRPGQCIEFNLRCGRSIGIDILIRLLSKRLQAPDVSHRGFVCCGFPLIPNDLYEEDPISSESAIFNVREIFDEIIDTTVQLADISGHVAVSMTGSSKSDIDDVKSEDNKEQISDEGVKILFEWSIDSEYSGSLDVDNDLEKQMKLIFGLFRNPYMIIYLYGTDPDVVSKRDNYYFDIYSNKTIDMQKIQMFNDIGASNEELTEDLFGEGRNPFAENPTLKHIVKFPSNFPANVNSQLNRYRIKITPIIDCYVLQHDQQYYLKLDGRIFLSKMLKLIKMRLKVLPLQPVLIPQKFLLNEEQPGEGVDIKEVVKMTPDEAVLKFSMQDIIGPMFKWGRSNWNTFCPVSMFNKFYVSGSSDYGVHFTNKMFLLANERCYQRFVENPRLYLLPPFPKPGPNALIFGPPVSGKSAVAKCLSYLLNSTILTPDQMHKEYFAQVCEEYKEQVRQSAIAEAMQILKDKRMEELVVIKRKSADWHREAIDALLKYIELYDLAKNKIKKVLSPFPLSMEAVEEGTVEQEEMEVLQEKLNSLNFTEELTKEEAEKLLEEEQLIMSYLPDELKHMPVEPSVLDPFVLSFADQKVAEIDLEDIKKKIDEDIFDIYTRGLRAIETGGVTDGWVIDGMTTDVNLLQQVCEEFPVYEVVILISSDINSLVERFREDNRDATNFKDFRKFFLELSENDAAWRAPSDTSTTSVKYDMAHTFIYEMIDKCFDEEELKIQKQIAINQYLEQVEKYHEEISEVMKILEEVKIKPVIVDVQNLSIEDLLKEVVHSISDKYRRLATKFTEDDRAAEIQQLMSLSIQATEGESTNQLNEDLIAKNRRYGDTYYYCPVTFNEKFVLWRGKEQFAAKFKDKVYLCANEINYQNFLKFPRKYLKIYEPPSHFPPPRVCVIGPNDDLVTLVAKKLSKNMGVRYLNYSDFTTKITENFSSTSLEGGGVDIPEALVYNMYDSFFTTYWFEDPSKRLGFVLDGFPLTVRCMNYMIVYQAIPDVIIYINMPLEEHLKRKLEKSLKEWREHVQKEREEANKLNSVILQEWEEKRKIRYNELMERKRHERYSQKISENNLGLEERSGDDRFASDTQISIDSILDQQDQDEVTKILDEEFPEPIFEERSESEDVFVENLTVELETQYNSFIENYEEISKISYDELIPFINVDGSQDLEKVIRHAFIIGNDVKFGGASLFERCYDITVVEAEKLLTSGYYFLSYFGRVCPVQYYQGHNLLHMFLAGEENNNVYPIIHRQYIYFVHGKKNRDLFVKNPLKYTNQLNFCFPLIQMRVAIIGPPRSGKTALANRFRRDFGFKLVSRGEAIRSTLANPLYANLNKNLEEVLRKGEELTDEMVMTCVHAASDCGESITRGLIFDGFPNSIQEILELQKWGLVPHLIFDLQISTEQLQKQAAIINKKDLQYSQRFMKHLVNQWQDTQKKFRDWCDREYQNIYKLAVDRSIWGIWDHAKEVTLSTCFERRHYYKHVKLDWPLRLANMLVTPLEFLERQSSYKSYCTGCLYHDRKLFNGGDPPDRTGLVQYRKYFYWLCDKHIEEFLKDPDKFLPPSNVSLPQELPETVHLTEEPKNVVENGFCLTCYLTNFPKKVLNRGTLDYVAKYKEKFYMFDTGDCQTFFMSNPEKLCYLTINFKAAASTCLGYSDLPILGMLEQYIASDVVRAVNHVNVYRPVIAGLSIKQAALIFLGLNLKKYNPRTKNLHDYEEGLHQYHKRRLDLLKALDFMKKYLNPYVHYEEPDTPSSSTRRVPVPDERFDYLCEYFKPLSKVPAFLNVVDIAGLVKGASEGQGLGNAFLSHISACDAIFHLCRVFEDDDVTHVEGEINPVRDLDIISEELRLKDEDTLMKNLEKLERTVCRGADKKLKPEYDTLLKIKGVLVDEKKHIRFGDWDAKDIEILNKYLFLTSKPTIYLVNLSEKDYIKKKNKWLIKIKEWVDKNDPGALIIPFSGAFEHKLVEEYSDSALRKKYLEEINTTSALDKIIVQGYKALQLEYFFTSGPDEVKAWTIQKGTKAPQAAGRIHTDFEKGFIMAEVMKFTDFKEEGSEAACKAAGKYRQQGRNYVVEDGDIIFFKFNAGAGLKDAKKK